MVQTARQIRDWLSALILRIQPERRPEGKKAPTRLFHKTVHSSAATTRKHQIKVIVRSFGSSNNTKLEDGPYCTISGNEPSSVTLYKTGSESQTGLMKMMTNFRGFLKKSTGCTRYIKMIQAHYPIKQPTAIFVRQSKPSLGTCKIPG